MLKNNYLNAYEATADPQKPLLSRGYDWIEATIFQSFSLLAYRAPAHYSVLFVQFVIGLLQYIHFLSDDYLPFKVRSTPLGHIICVFCRALRTSSCGSCIQEYIFYMRAYSFNSILHILFLIVLQWYSRVAEVCMTIARSVSRFPVPENSVTSFWVSVVLPWIWIVGGILAIVVHRMNDWAWPLFCLRIFLMWIPSVFFIPIIRHLFEMFFGCIAYTASVHQTHPFYSDMVCWSSEHTGYAMLALFTSVIYILACVITAYCFYDNILPSKINTTHSDSSRSSNVHEMIEIVGRALLLLLFTSAHTHQWTYALPFVYCLIPLLLLIYHVRYLPFYQDRTQFLFVSRAAVTLWTGICGVALVLLRDSEAQGMLYFVGVPIVFGGSLLAIRARYNHVVQLSEQEMTSPHLLILVTQATIRSFYRRLWSLGDIYVEESPALQAEHKVMIEKLERILSFGTARFPESASVRMMAAFFQAQVMQNRVLSYAEVQAGELCDTNFGERFFFYVSRIHLDYMASLANSTEVQTYMKFKEGKDRADEDMAAATRYLIQFWTLLMSEDVDVDELARLGHSARLLLGRSVCNYEDLLQLNHRSIPVLRTFGVVLLDVTGDTRRALAMFQAAEKIETEQVSHTHDTTQRNFLQQLDTNLDIFDDRNAIFTISVDRTSMGIIESANLAALRMFGYTTEGSMKGKNISIIAPQPMARYHDQYIIDYIARKTSRIVGRTRMIFALHVAGHLIPVNLYIRWGDEAKGKFVGVLSALTHEADVNAMVDPATKTLTYTTVNFYKFFGIPRRSVLAQEVQLYEVLPALLETDRADEYYEKMMGKDGWITEAVNQLTGRKLRVHVLAVYQRVYDEEVIYVRMTVEELATEKGEDSDSEPELPGYGLVDRFASVLDGARALEVEDANRTLNQVSFVDGGESVPLHTSRSEATSFLGPLRGDFTTYGADVDLIAGSEEKGRREHGKGADSLGGVNLDMGTSTGLSDMGAGGAVGTRTVEDMVADVDEDDIRSDRARAHLKQQMNLLQKLAGESGNGAGMGGDGGVGLGENELMEAVEGVRARAVESSAHARENYLKSRTPRTHMRLLRAIRNDANATNRRISVMNMFAGIVTLTILAMAFIVYFLTRYYLSETANLTSNTIMSTARAYYMMDAALHMRSYMLLLNAPWLSPFYYREHVFPDDSSASVLAALRARGQLMLLMNNGVATNVRAMGYSTKRQRELDITPSVPTSILVSSKFFDYPMSLFESVSSFVAEGYNLLGTSTITAKIAAHYFIVANALTSVREAVYEYGEEIRKGLRENHRVLLLVLILLMVVCMGGIGLLLITFILPAIIHVERAKHRVLDILLDIPPPVRRRIRRKLLGVLHVVRSSQENVDDDHDVRQAELDDAYENDGDKAKEGGEREQEDGEHGVFERYIRRTAKAGERLGQQSTGDVSSDSSNDMQTLTRAAPADLAKLRNELYRDTARLDANVSRSRGIDVSSHQFMAKYDQARVEIKPEHVTQYMNQYSNTRDANTSFSLTRNRTIRTVMLKYTLAASMVAIYFAVLYVQTSQSITLIEEATDVLDISTRRLPAILVAFFAVREYVFFDYSKHSLDYPDDPVLRIGQFDIASRESIAEARDLNFAVVFGSKDLKRPVLSSRQRDVMFGNSCIISPQELVNVGIYTDSFFWDHCGSVESGVLSHGLYAALQDVADSLSALLQPINSGIANHLLNQTPVIPGTEAALAAALARLRQLDTFVNDYLGPILQFSTSAFLAVVDGYVASLEDMHTVILIVIICLVLLAHFFVIRSIGTLLYTTSARSQAMLLLLPPNIIKTIPRLQVYIQDYVRLD